MKERKKLDNCQTEFEYFSHMAVVSEILFLHNINLLECFIFGIM